MPRSREGRRARPAWPLWGGLACTLVVTAVSCGVADERPPNPATTPASSAERAVARAQRAARLRAKAEQGPPKPAARASRPPAATPRPKPPAVEPTVETDAGPALDAGVVDAGEADAGEAQTDGGPVSTDAGTLDPAASCERMCDKVIACMRSIVGDMPPGMDEGALSRKLRKECMDECTADIDEHADEAAACLEIEDCSDFLDCIKDIDSD